jgi:hypothetical protein
MKVPWALTGDPVDGAFIDWWTQFHQMFNRLSEQDCTWGDRIQALHASTAQEARSFVRPYLRSNLKEDYEDAVANLFYEYGSPQTERLRLFRELRVATPASLRRTDQVVYLNLVHELQQNLVSCGAQETEASTAAIQSLLENAHPLAVVQYLTYENIGDEKDTYYQGDPETCWRHLYDYLRRNLKNYGRDEEDKVVRESFAASATAKTPPTEEGGDEKAKRKRRKPSKTQDKPKEPEEKPKPKESKAKPRPAMAAVAANAPTDKPTSQEGAGGTKPTGSQNGDKLRSMAPPGCATCGNNEHTCWQCPATVEAKKSYVMQQRLCFNCLRTNHAVKDCKSQITCRLCKRKHHTCIDRDYKPGMTISAGGPTTSKQDTKSDDQQTPNADSNPKGNTSTVTEKSKAKESS